MGLPLQAKVAMEDSEWLCAKVLGLLQCGAYGEVNIDLIKLVALDPCHDLFSTYPSAIRTPGLPGMGRLTQ